MGVDCTKCINSACCRLDVEITRGEYDQFVVDGLQKDLIKKSEIAMIENGQPIEMAHKIDWMYNRKWYAEIKKGIDGLCVLLDRSTMLCSIYENRPKVCREYSNHLCKNIRVLCTK